MDVKLVIIGGKANKSQVAVELPSVIGRSREADLTVAHPMISRKHCELYEVNGLVMVRDLGSLNGLFVGGRQVNEAALHPNAEFTVGPLTFRVEYQYAAEIALEPDATTVSESRRRQPAPIAEAGDFEVVDQPQPGAPPQGLGPDEQTPAGAEEAAGAQPLPGPADIPATIAPPDGEFPDLSAWGVEDAEPDAEQQAEEPLPPATFSADRPAPEDATPEFSQGETPEAETPSTPTPAPPETAAFEPGELAEIGQTDHPAVDVAEADQPPEGPAAEPADSEATVTQQPTGAADEETKGSAAGPTPEPDEAPEEGMFDLSLPPAAEADESDQMGTGDKELDEFLKGLE